MSIDPKKLQLIVEGALMAANKPLKVTDILKLFDEEEETVPEADEVLAAIEDIQSETRGRGFELKELASGYRFQVVQDVAPWVGRMWEEKPQKYSRALLETLALIAYRQPITRGDIEDIRGVAVSSHIVKTLMEREWIKVVGHKDVPGRPALFATTRQFLDYFNLKNLDELPTLAEIRDLDTLNAELSLEGVDTPLNEDGEAISGDEEAAKETTPEVDAQQASEDNSESINGDDSEELVSEYLNEQRQAESYEDSQVDVDQTENLDSFQEDDNEDAIIEIPKEDEYL